MNLLNANNMKRIYFILTVCLLALSNNMLAKPEAYSDNAWNINDIRDFERTYKKQDYNVGFLYSMLEQYGLEVYKADVVLENTSTQLTGNPMIKYAYLYPNLSEIRKGDSYYRLRLTVNKYPYYINDILDLVIAEEPPYDVYGVMAGVICNDYVFEEVIKGEESDDIGWSTLWVWKLKRELDNLFVNNSLTVKVNDIYSIMRNFNLVANDVNEDSTSPWADSEGRSYLRSLYLYSRNFENMRKGDKCYSIQIVLDFIGKEVDKDKFWSMVSEDNTVQSFMNKTGDYYAKKVIITVDSKL